MKKICLNCINSFSICFLMLSLPSVLKSQCISGNTGGTVWRDFNNNGAQDVLETAGVSSVIVNAYDKTGALVGTTTTDANGVYAFSSFTPSVSNPIRIEFSGIRTPYSASISGINNSTMTQFVTAVGCSYNLGVNNPVDYCKNDPYIFTSCYTTGDNTGLQLALVDVTHSSNSVGSVATANQVGATWGIAYNRYTKNLYSAAVVKRHSGLGPNGIGAIYKSDLLGATSLLYDFGSLAGSISSNAGRGLTTLTQPSLDGEGFAKAGIEGLGDIDISSDGSKLWVVNLKDKKLYSLNTNNPAPNSAVGVAIPDPGCTITQPTITSQLIDCGTSTPDVGYLADGITTPYLYRNSTDQSEWNQLPPLINTTSFSNTALSSLLNFTSQLGYSIISAYNIPVANGTYKVDLGFNYATPSNFSTNVSIEDVVRLTNYTVAVGRTAEEKSYIVTVTDGRLNINFSLGTGATNCGINAIRITQQSTGTAPTPTYRPWGMKIYDNDGTGDKIYVGVVCSAENTGNQNDLYANVMVYNPATSSWSPTPVLSFPLNYIRQNATLNDNANWIAWTNSFDQMNFNNAYPFLDDGGEVYPQPILSGIDFDRNGDMVLGFADRAGFQFGFKNYPPPVPYGPGGTFLMSNVSAGDVLRAGQTSANIWTVENNGVTTNYMTGTKTTTASAPNSPSPAGPGGNEFYWGDNYNPVGFGHFETSFGGLAMYLPTNELLLTAFDADATGYINSGGIEFLSNNDGSYLKGTNLYTNTTTGTFGKSTGLGDVELLCDPQSIEIGNYVWNDVNRNGVQDPGEVPFSNIVVSLYKGATKIASTTTNASGNYYFRSKSALGAGWTGTGIDTALITSTAYTIVFGETQYANSELTISGTKYILTTANSATNNGNDQNDSDASQMTIGGGTYPSINVSIPTFGSNHTFDVGFVVCPTITNPSTTQTICADITGSNITVQTSTNTANSIKFVKFTTDQTATNGSETAGELAAIYSGTNLATVTPSGAIAPYTATYTWNSADFPNATSSPITYYVYAILDPDAGAICRPVQEIKIIVNPKPSAPLVSSPITNTCPNTTVDLTTISSALSPSVSGGVFEWHQSNLPSSALVGTPTMVQGGIYYLFEKSLLGCYSTETAGTVSIQACCPTKICVPVTVRAN